MPGNECESYTGGVTGDAFKLCFHDACSLCRDARKIFDCSENYLDTMK